MSQKQSSFFLLKFSSSRLKDSKYRVNISFREAQENGEIVRLSDNQVLRTLRKIKGTHFSQKELQDTISERKRVFKQGNTSENREKVAELNKKIESILYVPEICSVKFENKSHYTAMKTNGFYINGQRYVRLLAGSGNLRRNTVFYIQERWHKQVDEILNNGRNMESQLVPAKFSAYYGLYNSSSLEVEFPKIVVVPDCEIEKDFVLDWVEGSGRDTDVTEKLVKVKMNLFDGQGLVSPSQMSVWSENIDLDYIPSWAIIRAPFMKGNMITFDFHALAKELGVKRVKDVWGKEHLIDDAEVLVSASQFKLWNSYESFSQYLENCRKNDLSFGVTRYSPPESKEKHHVFSNYQFTQVLDLKDKDIEKLCEHTVRFVKDISGFDYHKMSLYLLGEGINHIDERTVFSKIQDPIVKALLIEPSVAEDEYIRERFVRGVNKFVREAYLGATLHEGNFSAIISDPYAQAEFVFGLVPIGLLKDKEYYSNFWNKKKVSTVAACRAPLTHYSEVNVLKLVNDDRMRKWYSHITSGIVLPIGGNDTMIFAD